MSVGDDVEAIVQRATDGFRSDLSRILGPEPRPDADAAWLRAIADPLTDVGSALSEGGEVRMHQIAARIEADAATSASLQAENERLRGALRKLETAAAEVHRLGAQTGPQWHRLITSLVGARAALSLNQESK